MLFTPFANCQADWNCTFRIAGTQSSVVHGYRHCSALHSHWIHETWLLHLLLASQLPAVSLLAAKKTLGGNAYSNSADVTANLLGPSRKLETLHSCTCLLLCPYEPLGMMLLSVHYAEYGGSVWKAIGSILVIKSDPELRMPAALWKETRGLKSHHPKATAWSHPSPSLALLSMASKEVIAHLRKWKVTACCRTVSLLEPSSKFLLLWCLWQSCCKPAPCGNKAAQIWALRSSNVPRCCMQAAGDALPQHQARDNMNLFSH